MYYRVSAWGFREPGDWGSKQQGSREQGGKKSREQGAEEVIWGAGSRGKSLGIRIIREQLKNSWGSRETTKIIQGAVKNFFGEHLENNWGSREIRAKFWREPGAKTPRMQRFFITLFLFYCVCPLSPILYSSQTSQLWPCTQKDFLLCMSIVWLL